MRGAFIRKFAALNIPTFEASCFVGCAALPASAAGFGPAFLPSQFLPSQERSEGAEPGILPTTRGISTLDMSTLVASGFAGSALTLAPLLSLRRLVAEATKILPAARCASTLKASAMAGLGLAGSTLLGSVLTGSGTSFGASILSGELAAAVPTRASRLDCSAMLFAHSHKLSSTD